MNKDEDTNPQTETPESAPPDDYNEYIAWRDQTGGEPDSDSSDTPEQDLSSEASADAPAAESVGDSESPEEDLEQEPEAKEDEAPNPPKRKGGYQKRIDKLTREKHELAARVSELEARLAGNAPAGEKASGTDTAAAKPDSSPEGKPKPEDFETYEEFSEALTEWKLEQRERQKLEAERQREAERRRQEALAAWQNRQEEARRAHPDYDEVLSDADDVPLPGAMQAAILESERGPEIAYFLAKNRSEAKRIAGLASPIAIAREIGRIEASLASAPKPKPNLTRAPKPITPVKPGTGAPAKSIYDPSLAGDYNAWERARNAQLKRK